MEQEKVLAGEHAHDHMFMLTCDFEHVVVNVPFCLQTKHDNFITLNCSNGSCWSRNVAGCPDVAITSSWFAHTLNHQCLFSFSVAMQLFVLHCYSFCPSSARYCDNLNALILAYFFWNGEACSVEVAVFCQRRVWIKVVCQT